MAFFESASSHHPDTGLLPKRFDKCAGFVEANIQDPETAIGRIKPVSARLSEDSSLIVTVNARQNRPCGKFRKERRAFRKIAGWLWVHSPGLSIIERLAHRSLLLPEGQVRASLTAAIPKGSCHSDRRSDSRRKPAASTDHGRELHRVPSPSW